MRVPRSERLDRAGRWVKRIAWGIAMWFLGSHASLTIRSLWGTSTAPSLRQFGGIVLLAVAAGALGGLLLVGRGWQGLAFASIIGTVVWADGFVEAIPKTAAVCGGDAVGGCDHVMGVWLVGTALFALLPVAVGLFGSSAVWWLVRPTTRHALEYRHATASSSPQATAEQVAWAKFVAGESCDSA
jgi:hypothetical protein